MYSLLERRALERQPQPLAHCAVRAVGADEIGRAHRLLAGVAGQGGGHTVGVLLEAGDPHATLDLHAVHRQLLAQDSLGGVLRNRDEAERHVVRHRHVELRNLLAVDVDDLAAHQQCRVENAAQHAHALEHLERAGLHPNGFRILRRFEKRVDDAASRCRAGRVRWRPSSRSGRRLRSAPACLGVAHGRDYAAAMSIEAPVTVNAGHLIARRLRASGIDTIFTLSGGHLFSIYDGCRAENIRLIDTRHEQTAAFAAEGWSKVTRQPGVAALTAGPGVTNGMSAMAAAQQNQSPLVVLGGRAPALRWGQGSLQEIDHVPFVAPLTRFAATAQSADAVGGLIDDALRAAVGAAGGGDGRRVRGFPDGSRLRRGARRRRPRCAGRPARPGQARRQCPGRRRAAAGRGAATGDHGGHQRVVGACRRGLAGARRDTARSGADERHGSRNGACRPRTGVLASAVKSLGGGRRCAGDRRADGLPARVRRRIRRSRPN